MSRLIVALTLCGAMFLSGCGGGSRVSGVGEFLDTSAIIPPPLVTSPEQMPEQRTAPDTPSITIADRHDSACCVSPVNTQTVPPVPQPQQSTTPATTSDPPPEPLLVDDAYPSTFGQWNQVLSMATQGDLYTAWDVSSYVSRGVLDMCTIGTEGNCFASGVGFKRYHGATSFSGDAKARVTTPDNSVEATGRVHVRIRAEGDQNFPERDIVDVVLHDWSLDYLRNHFTTTWITNGSFSGDGITGTLQAFTKRTVENRGQKHKGYEVRRTMWAAHGSFDYNNDPKTRVRGEFSARQ